MQQPAQLAKVIDFTRYRKFKRSDEDFIDFLYDFEEDHDNEVPELELSESFWRGFYKDDYEQ